MNQDYETFFKVIPPVLIPIWLNLELESNMDALEEMFKVAWVLQKNVNFESACDDYIRLYDEKIKLEALEEMIPAKLTPIFPEWIPTREEVLQCQKYYNNILSIIAEKLKNNKR